MKNVLKFFLPLIIYNFLIFFLKNIIYRTNNLEKILYTTVYKLVV